MTVKTFKGVIPADAGIQKNNGSPIRSFGDDELKM